MGCSTVHLYERENSAACNFSVSRCQNVNTSVWWCHTGLLEWESRGTPQWAFLYRWALCSQIPQQQLLGSGTIWFVYIPHRVIVLMIVHWITLSCLRCSDGLLLNLETHIPFLQLLQNVLRSLLCQFSSIGILFSLVFFFAPVKPPGLCLPVAAAGIFKLYFSILVTLPNLITEINCISNQAVIYSSMKFTVLS